MRRIIDMVGLAVATLAIIASFAAAGVSLSDRNHSVAVTCRQVKHLREDLVAVLVSARDASLLQVARSQSAGDAREQRARINAFYAPQIARVGPVHCP